MFIELGTWHLLGLSCGGRGQRDRAILGTCFAECVYVVREWWRDEEMMETLTSQSSKAEDGVLPKQAL